MESLGTTHFSSTIGRQRGPRDHDAPHLSGQRKVAGYARNSDDPQEIARQETTILARHATLPDSLSELELVIFHDEGISGWSGKERPGFEEMQERGKTGEFAAYIVDTSSRLTRQGIEEALSILFGLKKVGCRLFTTTGKEYTPDLYGVILLSVDAQRDNDYSSDLSHNITSGIAEKARKGRPHYGKLVPGLRREDGRLIHTDDAPIMRDFFRRFLHDRLTYWQLADEATTRLSADARKRLKDGYVTGDRMRQWLMNVLYVGDMPHLGDVYSGQHDAIIDRETFDAVQRRIAVLSAENYRAPGPDPWFLQGFVKCGECRGNLSYQSANGGKYSYVRGRTPGCFCKETAWHAATFEANIVGSLATLAYAAGDLLVSMPEWGVAPREPMTADEARANLTEKVAALDVFVPMLKDRIIDVTDPEYRAAIAARDQAEQTLDRIVTATASYREELAELVAAWESLAVDAPPRPRCDDDVEVIYLPTDRHFSGHGLDDILRGWEAAIPDRRREVMTATLDRAYVSEKTVDLRFRMGIPFPIINEILMVTTGRSEELIELEEAGWGKRLENDVLHKPRSL